MRTIGVARLGLGNVGSGVVKLLEDNAEGIAGRLGARLEVRRIVVREVDRARLVEAEVVLGPPRRLRIVA